MKEPQLYLRTRVQVSTAVVMEILIISLITCYLVLWSFIQIFVSTYYVPGTIWALDI